MYSGFICGFINTATSPIVMVYGTDPKVEYGIGMGLMHGVVGITNLGLAIWNAHMWHKARTTQTDAPRCLQPLCRSLRPSVATIGCKCAWASLSASY